MPTLNVQPEAQGHALARTQHLFAQALLTRGDASAALALFREPPAVAAERLEVYRANVRAGRLAALKAAFPVVQQLVGTEFFEALARAHAQVQGSTSGDLNRFGQHFARFLRGFEPVQAQPELAYLPDVAQLEWAVHQAETAPNPSAAAAGQAQPMPPGFAVVESAFAIVDIWQWHQGVRHPDDTGPSVNQAQTAVVFRDGWRVRVLQAQGDDLAFAQAAAKELA
jgi:hypothetical protein